MRSPLLASALAPAVLSILAWSGTAHADRTAAEEPFGTTPAQQPQKAPAAGAPSSAQVIDREDVAEDQVETGYAQAPRAYRSSREAPIAADPPGDWAVLHAGLRPHLGTFGGIASFALAHARTESWYGGLSLSGVRNDAGTHIGGAQVALGRNLSDTFGGGVQLALSENRARHFYGIGQLSLAYNRTGEMIGAAQIGSYNRTSDFAGLAQVGAYNRADKSFAGVAEVGVFNHAKSQFSGLVQVGIVNATGEKIYGESNPSRKDHFAGITQIGVVSSSHGDFYGLAQIGVQSFTSRDFVGLVQVGPLGAAAGDFKGLAQIGLAALSKKSVGIQLGGGTIAIEEHTGLQVAGGSYAKSIDGAQIGVVNISERVRGFQLGLFNTTKSLRGVQIGLANHADDGVLPWTALLNMGFGDSEPTYERGDDEDGRDQYKAARGRARHGSL